MGDKPALKYLIVTVFLFLGLVIGVLLVPAMEGRGAVFGFGALAAGIIALSVIFARIYITKQRNNLKSTETGKKGSEVGFVVDTFHDLVAKLKEKERELEKLKSSAEDKASSMEAYSENILHSVPSGVISVDKMLMVKSVNQAAENILGIKSAEETGRNINDVFSEPLTSLMGTNEEVSRGEYQYATRDGRRIWLGITSSQLTNSSGDGIGFIFVFTDLTDIKALQSQVELKERLTQLGEMSAGISHELRNSMGVIAGYAKLLSKKVEPSARPTVDAISLEISTMNTIISELLAFAKPSVLHTEKVELNELIRETAETVPDRNEPVHVSINKTPPVFVDADRVLLKQALSNLLINASEAMPEGGEIDISIRSRGRNKAEVSVKDGGSGIPENIKQKIFLPFFTTKEQGIGFGLALVQKIIISHNGSIDVESTEGTGTVFRVTLPAVE